MNTPSPYALNGLLEKMSSPDSDFRYMSLNDLLGMLTSQSMNFAQMDPGVMSKLTDSVVRALDDSHGEVQNLAVKWYAPTSICFAVSRPLPLHRSPSTTYSVWVRWCLRSRSTRLHR